MSKKKNKHRSREKIRQRSIYETKPSLDRHKAHSTNRRRQRASREANLMRQSAYRAMKRYGIPEYPHTELIEVFDAQIREMTDGKTVSSGAGKLRPEKLINKEEKPAASVITETVKSTPVAKAEKVPEEKQNSKHSDHHDDHHNDQHDDHHNNKIPHTIFGGIKTWLRKIIRHA